MLSNETALIEMEMKRRWKNEYLHEIMAREQQKKHEVRLNLYIKQKENKLKLEKEHNERFLKEIQENKEKHQKFKQDIMNKLSFEYDIDDAKKRLKRLDEDINRKAQVSTSLDTNYEKRIHDFKENQSKLNIKNDEFSNNYLKFKNINNVDRVSSFQDVCFNPKATPNDLTNSYQINKNQLDQQILDEEKNLEFDKYKINKLENSKLEEINSQYMNYYNNQEEEKIKQVESPSKLQSNIISHNQLNNKNLNEIYQKSQLDHFALKKSIFEFNKEQIDQRYNFKKQEDQDKKLLIEQRMQELQRMNNEKYEMNMLKQQKQNSYRNILEMQSGYNNKYGDNLSNNNKSDDKPKNQFKFYVGKKNYDLGGTMLDHNPIINPVNSYSFAKYYIKRHNLIS